MCLVRLRDCRSCHDGKLVITSGPDTQVPAWVRRAVKLRDKACRFPGCNARLGDIHHLRRRRRGGSHEPSNLALLCRHHHRRLHEGGYLAERRPDGSLVFCNPHGLVLEPASAERSGSTMG
jgi:hypothetical protein